jgi:outer membrane biogenesis lipoprotein LolB
MTVHVDDRTYQSAMPEALLLELTGWRLPVDEFNLWLIADLNANDGRLERNDNGQITRFVPACAPPCEVPLHIEYGRYQRVNKLVLPHSIKVISPQQTLIFKISQWQ